jgi:hypothetical protein
MIRHAWTVLCSRSSVDSESNNMSLFDILEQVTIIEPPRGPGILAFPHEVVSLWTRDDLAVGGVTHCRYVVEAPGGVRTVGEGNEIDLTAFHRTRLRGRPSGLPVNVAGLYWVTTEQLQGAENPTWVEVSRLPVEVRFGDVPRGA